MRGDRVRLLAHRARAERPGLRHDPPPIPARRIQGAFDYYRAYPEEIDQAIAENDSWTYERLKESLPQLERFSVELDDDDDDIAVG